MGLAIWWLPVFAAAAWLGWNSDLARMGLFFSKAAVVTFGGAYAVLPYVALHILPRHTLWIILACGLAGLAL